MSEDVFRVMVAEEGLSEVRPIAYEQHHAPDLHMHDFVARGLVLTGAVTIVLADSSTTFRTGDVSAGTRNAEHTGATPTTVIVGVRPV